MDKISTNKQYSSVKRDEALKLDDQLENKNADSTDKEDDLKVYESCGCCFGVRYVHYIITLRDSLITKHRNL